MSYNKPFTVYKSSAGSGKTYTLVKEYIKLALTTGQKDYYRYILAITFTNKAAEEMKARVFVCLKDISRNLTKSDKNYTLQQSLSKELNIPIHELQHRAEQTLIHMLHHYSDIAISTIDKFTHRIIRTFAHDLNLPLNFEIEMDSDSLLNEAVEILLSKVGEQQNLTNFLVQFAETKADDDKSWNIENDILSFASNLLKEDNERFLNSLRNFNINQFVEIIKLMRSIQYEFLKSLKKIGIEATLLIENNGINAESFYQGKNGIASYFKKLSANKVFTPNSYVLKTIYENKWLAGKVSTDQKLKIESIKDELTSLFFDAQDILKEKYAQYLAIEDLLKNIHSVALLHELENILERIKTEQNILPIAEFNKRISKIIQHESAPFIYERIGEKYRHFLIDEFQDTSVMQWQNLLPLIHNSLSGGYFNMIVGDGKQSIYRWRGGEVEQFSQLPKIFSKEPLTDIQKEQQQALEYAYNEQILKKNWRSKKEIIQFNNQFFRFLSNNYLGEFSSIYNNLEQEYKEDNSGAWITCDIISSENNKNSYLEEDEENSADSIQQALELTLQYIYKHIELGYKQKDICVLCRKNNQGQQVADFLIKHNLNVISPDSLLLASNQTIQFILHVLSYAVVPDNKVAQVKILEYLIHNQFIQHLLPEELFLQISNGEKSIESILNLYNIQLSNDIIVHQSLIDAVESIVRIFNLNKIPDPYIQFFLNAVFEFSTTKNNSISDFLEWFDKKSDKLSIILPEGSDAIQIMTIHKSKGLEFPVVIMPFVNEHISNSNKELWVNIPDNLKLEIPVGLISSNNADENNPFVNEKLYEKNKTNLDIINLLYVAFTRAVDSLHLVFTDKTKSNTYAWFSQYFAQYLDDFNKEKRHYEISPLTNELKPQHKEVKETSRFEKVISSPWYEKLQLSLTAPEAWNIDNPDQASEYGKQLHDIIAAVNSEDDLNEVLENFIFFGNISQEDSIKIKNEVIQIVKHPLLNKYFSGEYHSINEVEIIDEKGTTYRPDKIFLKNNEAVILDFKTGRKKALHELQIKNYALLLANLGFKVTEKCLCYTHTGEVINV